MTGIVAAVGRLASVRVGSGSIQRVRSRPGNHGTRNKVNLRAFERRPGEVLLRADLFDHRLIDVPAAELVHAYDVELEDTGTDWVLARLDTRRPPRLFGLMKRTRRPGCPRLEGL